jgi:HEAT repeat protein
MPGRRRASRRFAGILAGAVIIAAIVIGYQFGFFGAWRTGSAPNGSAPSVDEKTPMSVLNEGLRNSDARALAQVQERLAPKANVPARAISDAEGAELLETLAALRTGFLRFNSGVRPTAINAAHRIFDKFAIEPAPACWLQALQPLHDMLSASLADVSQKTRLTALEEIGRLWVWVPGRSLMPIEEQTLADWKGGIHPSVLRCLASSDPTTRMAAVACLGTAPDSAAIPALAYLDDTNAEVRQQAMVSFSQRSLLMTDDMLFRRLHDENPTIREQASLILKIRGRTQEQIGLGGLMYSGKAEQRMSVIPLLKNRTDLDPVVWLIQLSRDPVETVRLSAIEALATYKTPSVQKRLAEMARFDRSQAVRSAASKFAPVEETTASLPPLPGSSSLNPKAN